VEYHTGAVVLDALVKQDKEAIIQAGKQPRALDGEDSVEGYDQCHVINPCTLRHLVR
jgi:hypothetical protein